MPESLTFSPDFLTRFEKTLGVIQSLDKDQVLARPLLNSNVSVAPKTNLCTQPFAAFSSPGLDRGFFFVLRHAFKASSFRS